MGAPDGGGGGADGEAVAWEIKGKEGMRSVGGLGWLGDGEVEAGKGRKLTERGGRGGLLDDAHGEAVPPEFEGGDETADARAGDQDGEAGGRAAGGEG